MFLRRSQCGLTQTSGLSSVENTVKRHQTEMLKTRQLETDIFYSLLNVLSLPSSFRVGASLTHALAFPQVCCSHLHCPACQLCAKTRRIWYGRQTGKSTNKEPQRGLPSSRCHSVRLHHLCWGSHCTEGGWFIWLWPGHRLLDSHNVRLITDITRIW